MGRLYRLGNTIGHEATRGPELGRVRRGLSFAPAPQGGAKDEVRSAKGKQEDGKVYNVTKDKSAKITDIAQEVGYEDGSSWVGGVVMTDERH